MNLFLDWRDPIEILFFVTIIYYCTRWLKKDAQTNLVAYFYGYLTVFCVTYFLRMETISSTMLIFSPLAAVIGILFHQQTLQKQMITLKRFTPKIPDSLANWDEVIFKVLLQQLNQQKSVYIVIEQEDTLYHYLKSPFLLDVIVQTDLLTTLLASPYYHEDQFIWITNSGKLMAINARWNIHDLEKFSLETTETSAWKEYGALYSSKTDALILKSNPANRSISMIAQGKCVDDLTPAQAHGLVKKYCLVKKDSEAQKDYYANDRIQKRTQQPQQ